jgi:N-acetylmuramoyl-L-alanine amidase
VLDAGHGGSDPGTVGIGGVHEKDVTLAVVREMRRVLEASGRYVVRLTRDGDELIRLRDRMSRARAAGADVFISVHADSIGSSETRGASVYTLSDTASDAEAAALAQRENRADIIAGVDLSHESKDVASILIDLAQRETMNSSARFAQTLVEELAKDVRLLPNNPHRFAGFVVLKAPDTPALLLELGYLSNREDAALLRTPEHRRRLAQALLRAVDQYFGAGTARPAGRG